MKPPIVSRRRFPVLWLLAVLLVVFVGWAAWFDIDQAVRATGQFIPSSRTQVIQAVDGGVLQKIAVHEGDRVAAGELLASLEPDRPEAAQAQSRAEVMSRQAAILRAHAELSGRPPYFGPEFAKHQEFVAVQTGLYLQRRRGLDEELAVQQKGLALAEDELAMADRLFQSGDVSRTEVMRAQRAALEIQARINGIRNKYLQDARQELARLEDDLAASRQRLEERSSVLVHTELTAPVAGIVKLVRITTIGGVLRPGDELMQISPTGDESLIELKVNPADIGQLRVGLPVRMRLDAFDSGIYGTLEGRLIYISSDTLTEQAANAQQQTYYRARAAIEWPADYRGKLQPGDIKAGMTATADVLTGQRSVLHYLFKPVLRAFSGAMTER